ncbi:MAG TPA: hypothetical protein VMV93_02950 [Chloroflexota bacterium]|nr:hypothetical protein [Chloroflexota bacterium]
MSVIQQSFPRDRQRYPGAVGCLMWWGLFSACIAGYLLFFFGMSLYKAELGPSQICTGAASPLCVVQNTVLPIVIFGLLFVSQLYMIFLVESRKSRSSLGRTYGMLVVSMIFLPVFGTVIGLYLIVRMARDPWVQAFYAPATDEKS